MADIAHAKLSASGSSRWLTCTASIQEEEKITRQERSSVYAREGTFAHDVADECLKKGIEPHDMIGHTDGEFTVDEAMADYLKEYTDYVRSHISDDPDQVFLTEQRLDFSHVVPEGFGTTDSAIINTKIQEAHVFDLKYGRGEMVDAVDNTQGLMYALGLDNEYGWMADIQIYHIHIIQPRRDHISSWTVTKTYLHEFAEIARHKAAEALGPDPVFQPGIKQCRWCKASSTCKALYDFTGELLANDFEDLDTANPNQMTHEQMRRLLDHGKFIENFIGRVADHVETLLRAGKEFEGYKLVMTSPNRKWDENAEKFLKKMLKKDAYKEPTLIGITEAKKRLPKGTDLDPYLYKPEGKIVMAKEADRRKAVDPSEIVGNDFDDLDGEEGEE